MTAPLNSSHRTLRLVASLGAIAVVSAVLAQGDDPVSSLPGGPKSLLVDLGANPSTIGQIVGAARSSEEWIEYLAEMETSMNEDQLAILAEYLAFNAPATASGTDVPAIIEQLPPDGRELFAANCFSCHGVASYYLLQDRDAAGWMDIFSAPYHRRLLTGENERETFSSYAARAMPIPVDEIPEAWRQ